MPALKEELELNVELACAAHRVAGSPAPADFIPELPGWRDRALFIERHGHVDYFHYDLYAQALSKIERGHTQDQADIRAMRERGLVDPSAAMELLASIEPELYRYPAIDPPSFRRAVETMFAT